MVRRLASALLVTVIAGFGVDVVAMSPPIGRPSRIALLEGTSDVEMQSAQTTLVCRALDDCTFTTHYEFENASGVEQAVDVFADGHRIAGLELQMNGAPMLGEEVARDEDMGRDLPAVTRTTRRYTFRFAPGTTQVVTSGAMQARDVDEVIGVAVSLAIRHPLLGTDPGFRRRRFLFDITTVSGWGGNVQPTFTVEAPSDFEVQAPSGKDGVDPDASAEYSVQLSVRPRGVVHGGPYLGVGGLVDEPGGLFGRVGYEFGVGLWTVLGLAFDTDFGSRHIVAPTLHSAFAGYSCIFPSFGLGVGPAVQFGGVTTVGARGLFEIQLPFVGFVGSLDWYPGLEQPDRWDFSVLGRLSL